jgi:hypothetical protein
MDEDGANPTAVIPNNSEPPLTTPVGNPSTPPPVLDRAALYEKLKTGTKISDDDIQNGFKEGLITEDEATTALVKRAYADNLFKMDPGDVEYGLDKGIIPEEKAEKYIDYKRSPIWSSIKDGLKGIPYGIQEVNNSVNRLTSDFLSIGSKPATYTSDGVDYQSAGGNSVTLPNAHVVDEPDTIAGQVIGKVVEYGLPFTGVLKGAKALEVGARLGEMLPEALSKAGPWLASTIENLGAGAVTDFTLYDSKDGHLADLLKEHLDINNTLIDWLRTDPNDDAMTGRFKAMLEGGVIGIPVGVAVDALFSTLSVVKKALWVKHGDNPVAVIRATNWMEDFKGADETLGAFNKMPEVSDQSKELWLPGAKSEEASVNPGEAFGYKTPMEDGYVLLPGSGEKAKVIKVDGDKIFVDAGEGKTIAYNKDEVVTSDYYRNMGRNPGEPFVVSKVEPKVILGDEGKPLAQVVETTTEHGGAGAYLQVVEDLKNGVPQPVAIKPMEGLLDKLSSNREVPSEVFRAAGVLYENQYAEATKSFTQEEIKKEGEKAFGQFASTYGLGLKEMKSVSQAMGDAPAKIYAFTKQTEAYSQAIMDKISSLNINDLHGKAEVLYHLLEFSKMNEQILSLRSLWSKIGHGFQTNYKLDAFRDVVTHGEFRDIPAAELEHLMSSKGIDADTLIRAFSASSDMQTKVALAKSANGTALHNAMGYFQANMLWRPATQLKNISENVSTLLRNEWAYHMALGYEAANGKGYGAALREFESHWYGYGQGLVDSIRLPDSLMAAYRDKGVVAAIEEVKTNPEVGKLWKALLDGHVNAGDAALAGKTEAGKFPDIFTILNVKDQNTKESLMKLTMGDVLTTPFKLLAAGDTLFSNPLYHSRLNTLIAREANERIASGVLKAADAHDFMTSWRMNVPREIHEEATKFAQREVMTTPLEGTLAKLDRAVTDSASGMVVKAMTVPFLKVMTNVARYAYEMSPLKLVSVLTGTVAERVPGLKDVPLLNGLTRLSSSFREDIAAGGMQRYEALSRLSTGNAMFAAAVGLQQNGYITGFVPPQSRDAWSNAGMQGYSIKLGKDWYSLNSMGPAGILLGLAASCGQYMDMVEHMDEIQADKRTEALVSSAILLMTDPVVNQTMGTGLKDIAALYYSPERMDMKKMVVKKLTTLVPMSSGLAWLNETKRSLYDNDDSLREVVGDAGILTTIIENVIGKGDLPMKRHAIYGTVMDRSSHIFGVREQDVQMTKDKVLEEMVNINAGISPMSKFIHLGGGAPVVELEPSQYERLREIVSTLPVKETLAEVINDPGYKSIPDDFAKAKVLKGIVNNFRAAARGQFLGENEDVRNKAISGLEQKAMAYQNNDAVRNPFGYLQHLSKAMDDQ